MFQERLAKLSSAAVLTAASFAAEGCGGKEPTFSPVSAVRTFGTELKLTVVEARSDTTTWKANVTFSPGLAVNADSLLQVTIYDGEHHELVNVLKKELPRETIKTISSIEFTFDTKQVISAPYAYAIFRDDGVLDLRIESLKSR